MLTTQKNFMLRALSLLALITFLIGSGVDASAQRKRKPRLARKPRVTAARPVIQSYTLPIGTKMRVRMDDELTSKTAKGGDIFTGTLVDPVYSTGVVVIPAGSKVLGRITTAKKAERKGKPGEIDVNFYSVRMPDGTNQPINGSLTDLSEGGTKTDNEGTARGDGLDNRHLIFVGGGAAGGALIGAIAGGGKGAGIGAIVGAGAGLAGDLLTKGPEAEVKSGTEFGVVINQTVTLREYK